MCSETGHFEVVVDMLYAGLCVYAVHVPPHLAVSIQHSVAYYVILARPQLPTRAAMDH
jgi:hypothetical protein